MTDSPTAPWLSRDLIRLWLAQVLSGIGDVLHEIALMWIAVEAIGERAGLVAVAGPAARLLFGLFGGVYADRWDRQRAMIATDLLRAAAVGSLAIAALYGTPSLWHLAVVAGAVGMLDSIFGPALQASLPALSPDPAMRQRANVALNMTKRLSRVVGPALAGALLAVLPISHLFSADAATFVASALVLRALGRGYRWKSESDPGPVSASMINEVRLALAQVWAHKPLLWGISLIGVWNIASACIHLVGAPLLARDILGGGPGTYGAILAAYGVGNVASNLAFLTPRVPRYRERFLFSGGVIYGAFWTCAALWPSFESVLAFAALAAIGGPICDLMILQIIQTEIPEQDIGKVYSVRRTVSQAFNGLGLLFSGVLYSWFSVPAGIGVAAATVAVFSAIALLRFRRSPPVR